MLAHEVRGKGSPVVLLHAFPLSSRMWQPQTEVLTSVARVVTVDLPGFGKSPRQKKPSIPEAAGELAQLLDHLQIQEPVFVAGLSMGGYVAFEFLRQFPQRVKGLGIFSSRSAADTPEGREKRFKGVESIRQHGLEPYAKKIIANLLGKTTLETRKEISAQVLEMILSNPAETVIDALMALAERNDSTAILAGIKVPALVVAGDEDSFLPFSESREMHEKIPGSEFQLIPQAGHLVNLEQPGFFNRILQDFLLRRILK